MLFEAARWSRSLPFVRVRQSKPISRHSVLHRLCTSGPIQFAVASHRPYPNINNPVLLDFADTCSTLERPAGRTVTAMNIGVTILARAAHRKYRVGPDDHTMTAYAMTL